MHSLRQDFTLFPHRPQPSPAAPPRSSICGSQLTFSSGSGSPIPEPEILHESQSGSLPCGLGKTIWVGKGGLPWGTVVQASFQNLHLLPTCQVLSLVPLQKVTPSPHGPKPHSTKSALLTPPPTGRASPQVGRWACWGPTRHSLHGPGAATPCTQFGGGLGS